ncbi:hypothetical protein JCM12141A_11630 [Mycolicibacterium hodleri]
MRPGLQSLGLALGSRARVVECGEHGREVWDAAARGGILHRARLRRGVGTYPLSTTLLSTTMDWPDVLATPSSVAQPPRRRHVCGRTVTSFDAIPCLECL